MNSIRRMLLLVLAVPCVLVAAPVGTSNPNGVAVESGPDAPLEAGVNAGAMLAASREVVEAPALTGIATVGGTGNYRVRSGDNLAVIGGRLGLSVDQLREMNAGSHPDRLKPGQVLTHDNRHIVPPPPVGQGDVLRVNIPQRMLFHYRDGQLRAAYPVAAGRPDRRWRTPTGEYRVTSREKDKTWIVPPSIQNEMRAKGEPVLTRVPPGPKNPLGRYWLGLSRGGLGIHGTHAPASIYGLRTHGCIRLQPEHIEALFGEVGKGTPVVIVYAPILLYAPSGGPVWLEVHPDAYALGLDYRVLLRGLVETAGIAGRIDPDTAQAVLTERAGLARDVSRRISPPGLLPVSPDRSTRPVAE